jgi:hypothetical protein
MSTKVAQEKLRSSVLVSKKTDKKNRLWKSCEKREEQKD